SHANRTVMHPTLIPSTTLVRSVEQGRQFTPADIGEGAKRAGGVVKIVQQWVPGLRRGRGHDADRPPAPALVQQDGGARARLALRSEEHTSELQSRENLVCRLLL